MACTTDNGCFMKTAGRPFFSTRCPWALAVWQRGTDSRPASALWSRAIIIATGRPAHPILEVPNLARPPRLGWRRSPSSNNSSRWRFGLVVERRLSWELAPESRSPVRWVLKTATIDGASSRTPDPGDAPGLPMLNPSPLPRRPIFFLRRSLPFSAARGHSIHSARSDQNRESDAGATGRRRSSMLVGSATTRSFNLGPKSSEDGNKDGVSMSFPV